MNVLTITGNLTKDLELKKTNNGVSVVSGTIAVQRAFKGPNGEKGVDFIDFVAWDKKAEYLSQYAKKGDRLEISGRLESRKYTDRNNQERFVWECIIENVMSFSKRQADNSGNENNIPDDDLPF
jgi:single-strand DNA-binding protein